MSFFALTSAKVQVVAIFHNLIEVVLQSIVQVLGEEASYLGVLFLVASYLEVPSWEAFQACQVASDLSLEAFRVAFQPVALVLSLEAFQVVLLGAFLEVGGLLVLSSVVGAFLVVLALVDRRQEERRCFLFLVVALIGVLVHQLLLLAHSSQQVLV